MEPIRVRDIMSSPVETISGDNHTIKDAAVFMMRKNIGSLIVIKADEGTSIITERDIVRAVADDNMEAAVSEYMADPLITIHENSLITEACALMLENRIRRLPAVDDEGLLSGIINLRDVTISIQKQLQSASDMDD